MIGCDAHVRRALGDHVENRRDDASHRRHLHALRVFGGRQRVVVAEELVGAVDEVNVQ